MLSISMPVQTKKRKCSDEEVVEFKSRISSCQSLLLKYSDDMKKLSDYLLQHRQDVDMSSLSQPLKDLISQHNNSFGTLELRIIAEDTGMLVT